MTVLAQDDAASGSVPWFAVLVLATLALVVVGVILIRRWDWKNHRTARMRLQGLLVIGALLAVLGLIVTVPIDSDARNALLTFYGVLIAAVMGLTATTHVGNFLAGLIITSRGSFEAGDFIRSGDLLGGVTQQKLLHTEVETEDGDLTLLPNLRLVTEPLTVLARHRGTVVSAEVSLGYDVPHGRVATLLKEAAADDVKLQDPFVLISELGDFSVTYRVAGLLKLDGGEENKAVGSSREANERILPIISTRSRLRKAILDALHGAGIEIVSPTFMNQRQLQPHQRFVPHVPVAQAAAAEDENVEATIYRKVDMAVSVDDLEAELAELVAKEASLEEQMKAGGDDGSMQRASDNLVRTQQAIEAQMKRIDEAKQEISDS